jgi:hypothetical protein
METANGIASEMDIGFVYDVEHLQPTRLARWITRWLPSVKLPDLLYRKVDQERLHNLVPLEGRQHILSVIGNAGTQITTWYVLIFEGNYTPVSGDTMATFPASATECTAYTAATRPEWVEAAPSAGVITNSASKAEFTANATKTVYGAALSSSSVKGGTSGTLLSAGRFATSKTVDSGDVLRVTGNLTLNSSS